ncbi:MAG: hypothetical protein ACR2LK_04270 [Solirubrobacteraceae bacterium]
MGRDDRRLREDRSDPQGAPARPAARGLHGKGAVDVGALAQLPHGTDMRIGALVVARQRPGTARGIRFMLIEDEHDTVNVIVAATIMSVIAGRCAPSYCSSSRDAWSVIARLAERSMSSHAA